MYDIDQPQRGCRELARLLRAFEGPGCLWRIATAAAIFGAATALPFAGAAAGIVVGANLDVANVLAGSLVSVGSGSVAVWLSRRAPWRTVLEQRLRTYEEPNPHGFVELLVRDHDFEKSFQTLRRARFAPLYGARVGSPPPDAPDLTVRIGVQEPAAWPQSESDEDRLWRLASVLAAAGVRARVASADAFASGQVIRRSIGTAE